MVVLGRVRSRMSEVPLYRKASRRGWQLNCGSAADRFSLQGYLAHKSAPPPPSPNTALISSLPPGEWS